MAFWWMDHTCTIERAVLTSDGGGGQVKTWNPVVTDLPCRAWYDSAQVASLGNKPAFVEMRKIVVPLGTDVTEGDRVASVKKAGTVIFAGPMAINSVAHRQDHIQLYILETN